MNARIMRVVAAGLCFGLLQTAAWSANIPTHDTGFIQPGRTSEVSQPNLRHLYIIILIDSIEHRAVTNGGIGANQFWVDWEMDSSVAWEDPLQMYGWPLLWLFPGDTWYWDPGRVFYRAYVPFGCNMDVDLELYIQIRHKPAVVGQETFNDVIPGHGHYPVYIPIYATEDNQASEFILRGRAQATCTNDLPPDDAEPPG